MTTLTQLAQGLNNLYPTRFSHFPKKQSTPFITYIETDYDNIVADNVVIVEGIFVDIELYTDTKDLVAERRIKDYLNSIEQPYTQSETVYIESERLFQVIFSIKLINRI